MLRQEIQSALRGESFDFEDLALQVFAYQFERCGPYRSFCQRRGARPDTVSSWRDIPPLPVEAFKHARIFSGEGDPAHFFETSGTTGGAERRGRHYFGSLDLYAAALKPAFKRYVLPDRARIRMFMLAPPPSIAPHSSLSWYLEQLLQAYGAPDSGWYVDDQGLRLDALPSALAGARGPVALLGTAFAFVHMADAGLTAVLPPGSRAMETGGFKGRSRELAMADLHRLIRETLGVSAVINQYGMTELASQFYGNEQKRGPAWLRARMLHPDTLAEVDEGQPGLIALTDLANLDSCAFLLTQDMGIQHPDGSFTVLGRVPGAEARGLLHRHGRLPGGDELDGTDQPGGAGRPGQRNASAGPGACARGAANRGPPLVGPRRPVPAPGPGRTARRHRLRRGVRGRRPRPRDA